MKRSLAHLPVGLFASVMGVAGISVAWRRASAEFGVTTLIASALAWLALATFIGLAAAYGIKVARHFSAVRSEWAHPVKGAFAPAITIGLLVLGSALGPDAPALAKVLWWVGASGHLAITLLRLSRWMGGPAVPLDHIHPGWFLAPVGNIVAPLGGESFAPTEVLWFFFAVGLAYWIILVPIVVFRLIVGDPLPSRLSPTLAILIAPPAVAALSWVRLGHSWTSPLPILLLGLACFQLLLLVSHVAILRKAPFAPSAWAYTFPLAALSIALLWAAADTSSSVLRWSGATMLGIVTLIVIVVGARTVVAAFRGEFTRPEPAPVAAQ